MVDSRQRRSLGITVRAGAVIGALVSVIGCSSSDFALADQSELDTGLVGDAMVDDTSPADTTLEDSLVVDTLVDDTRPADTGVITADAATDSVKPDTTTVDSAVSDSIALDSGDAGGCGVLGAEALEVYVDKNGTRSSVGTATCPFRSIREATLLGNAPTGTRTIHVAGAPSSVVIYDEAAPLNVADRVVLLGEGGTKPRIGGAAAICGSDSALVCVQSGAVVDGFTIQPSTGNAIVTLSGAGALRPTLRNLLVFGSNKFGIEVFGGAILGPNLQSNFNTTAGLQGAGSGAIDVVGTGNTFDNNVQSGIVIASTLQSLNFKGGTASKNGQFGIFLAGYSPVGTPFTISNLVAKGNSIGLLVNDSTSVILRTSTLIGNKVGLKVNFGFTGSTPKNMVDLGVGALGGNVFGAGDVAVRNALTGMCLSNTMGTGSLTADGNRFSVCPPAQLSVTSCDAAATSVYYDIWYVKNPTGGAPDPVKVTSCAVGP